MTVIYPVIFTRTDDKKDTYLIEIPDIGGMSEGYGLADSINMARDLIGCKLLEKEDGGIPSASAIEQINPLNGMFADAGESFVSLIDLDLSAYRRKNESRAVRKNVSIPAWLDREAAEANLNLSRILQDALKEKLNIA